MIPAGYMAKHVAPRPDWLPERLADIYSVSACISRNFADYIGDWLHNGYWLFDSPDVIRQVARNHSVDVTETDLFFYEVHDQEYDEDDRRWSPFAPDPSFTTQVVAPTGRTLEGFDVVTFAVGTNPECSPLSCSGLSAEIETNEHCLLPSFERARELLEEGRFDDDEPGPFRIFAVYSVSWPAEVDGPRRAS